MGYEPKVATIPAWRGFVDDLAFGLLQRAPEPLQLATTQVLVPNRRAARALSDAFLRHAAGRALLLPRISVLGDLEANDLAGSFATGLAGEENRRPEIPPLARRLLLARLLAGRYGAPQALGLGLQLGAAVDTLLAEKKTAADLDAAAPDALLQEHWLQNRAVLGIAVDALPQILAGRGLADPVLRTNLLLEAVAERWQKAPPSTPIILAGVAHAIPAVKALARVVARLPEGLVLLPGFRPDIRAEAVALIRGGEGEGQAAPLESHPMFGMLALLEAMGVAPAEVTLWPFVAPVAGSAPARAELVAQSMAPAALAPAPVAQEPLEGVQMVEAATATEEAAIIAVALRQVVEVPGRTGLLVTPDRQLARRVRVQLQRFGIAVDDSAGVALAATLPGNLLVALAAAAGENFAPVALLSLLMHPLVRQGEERLPWLGQVRALDKALRGLRPAPGLRGVTVRLENVDLRRAQLQEAEREALLHWWKEEVTPMLAPLAARRADGAQFFRGLVAGAQALAGEALWQREAGRQLAQLVEALEEAAADLGHLKPEPQEYESFVRQLLAGETVRPKWRQHPQLQILGPLEARLQRADLVVLGGLNEGVWPARPAPDPFLAPVVRRRLGLPHLGRRIGMQAHDLMMALGAPEVLLTRALRDGKAPTVASRFWVRLAAAAGSLPDSSSILPAREALQRAVDTLLRQGPPGNPSVPKWEKPAPVPPLSARPKRLSVTEVALLKADPFAFYARHVLGLAPLELRDRPVTAADRGTLVHGLLEKLFSGGGEDLGAAMAAALQELGDGPEVFALWRPRFLQMVRDAQQKQETEGAGWEIAGLEKKGHIVRQGVELVGRADRIDVGSTGLRIIDYKTGGVPSQDKVAKLWETQLALLAEMAREGAFAGVPAREAAALSYWKISGTLKPGKVMRIQKKGITVAEHVAAAVDDFDRLIGHYLLSATPFTAKASMRYGGVYKDYDQLARVAEWLRQ